jgi:hypothetical protein
MESWRKEKEVVEALPSSSSPLLAPAAVEAGRDSCSASAQIPSWGEEAEAARSRGGGGRVLPTGPASLTAGAR